MAQSAHNQAEDSIMYRTVSHGIEVKVNDVLTGFIRRAELARDKADQRPDRFAIGEKVDAKITAVDRQARKLTLTIKGNDVVNIDPPGRGWSNPHVLCERCCQADFLNAFL